MNALGWVVLLGALALVPAFIAARKTPNRAGWTFATFYLFGLLLWIAAVPVAIWVVKDERKRKCPHCFMSVPVEAIVCGHCQRDLEPATT